MRLGQLFICSVLLLLQATPAAAQQAQLRASRPPYYTGVPVEVQVVAEGFEEEPQPEVDASAPPGTTLQLLEVSPNVSTMMRVTNGRVERSREVSFVYKYRFLAAKPGRYRIGPFTVRQGSAESRTVATEFEVGEIPLTDSQRIRLLLPQTPIYVGQLVPVALEWWADAATSDNLYNPRVIVPMFQRAGDLRFIDTEDPAASDSIVLVTPTGAEELPATAQRRREGGRAYVVRRSERTMVALKPGRWEPPPASLVVEEAIRWRRDFFGSRTATESRQLRAMDATRVLDVQPLPAKGRPDSFAGAVGEGFSVELAADRSVVRVGDPITLTFTIRGDGALEEAALPPLEAMGLAPEQFRAPSSVASGNYADGEKRFEVAVRVLDASVEEIPPLAYSWFEPKRGEYRTAHAQPIALSVAEATVVGAGDVVRGHGAQPDSSADEDDQRGSSEPNRGAQRSASPTPFTLSGADLAIEDDLTKLDGDSGHALRSTAVQAALYAGGLLAWIAGLMVRRRRSVDPALRGRRQELAKLQRALGSANTATETAGLLRRMRQLGGNNLPPRYDAVLRQLDELSYAPGGGTVAADGPLHGQAVELAKSLAEVES